MVYAEPFVQLRILGSFGASGSARLEEWSCGVKLRNPGVAPSPAALDAFLADCEDPIEVYHAGPGQLVGSNVFLQELTAAFIGTDGLYVGGASQQTTRRVTGPTPGGGNTNAPWTQAICISLRTSVTRGPGSNGRIYYPFTGGVILGSTGLIPASQSQAIANAAKTMLDGINAAAEANLPGTGGVAVMSNVSVGVAATVTSVRVGRRMDRQERRENALPEDYQVATLAAAALVGTPRSHIPIGD